MSSIKERMKMFDKKSTSDNPVLKKLVKKSPPSPGSFVRKKVAAAKGESKLTNSEDTPRRKSFNRAKTTPAPKKVSIVAQRIAAAKAKAKKKEDDEKQAIEDQALAKKQRQMEATKKAKAKAAVAATAAADLAQQEKEQDMALQKAKDEAKQAKITQAKEDKAALLKAKEIKDTETKNKAAAEKLKQKKQEEENKEQTKRDRAASLASKVEAAAAAGVAQRMQQETEEATNKSTTTASPISSKTSSSPSSTPTPSSSSTPSTSTSSPSSSTPTLSSGNVSAKRGKVAAMLAAKRNNAIKASTPETKQPSSKLKKKRSNKINALAGKLNFGAGGISPFGRGRPMSIAAPRSTPPGGLGGLACQPAHTRTRSRSTASEPMVTGTMNHATMGRPTLPKRRTPTPVKGGRRRRPASMRVTKTDMMSQLKK